MGTDAEQLNAAQRQAVDITDGPALVVAGAGTGKTKVITERIIRLVKDGIKPENILALTFTEKAAGEMLDRVSDASLNTAVDATIATYNGFGNDLLKAYGNEWGLGNLQLLSETGQLVFLREHFDEYALDYFAPISNPDGQLSNLRAYVSELKQQLVQPKAYIGYADALSAAEPADKLEKTKHQELARFYAKYLELCRQHLVIDYDDQIFLTIQLLQARPNVLRQLQQRYRYILVDEFQDTNPMQSALIDLLAGREQTSGSSNLMVVGDDDQSIYGWRGATLANILDFKQRYPSAKDITLIENYRSTQAILDAAYRMIQANNPERLEVINHLDKRLHAQTNDGPAPLARHFYTLEAELTWIAEDIAARIKNGQDPSGIAILARRTAVVERAHEALELHNVPHALAGKKNDLYSQPIVQQLIETLRAVSDPLDDMALFHTLSSALFDTPIGGLAQVAGQARRAHDRLSSAITASDDEALKAALQQIETWRESHKQATVGALAYAIITDTGLKQRLYENADSDAESYTQAQAVGEFFKTLAEFQKISTVASVQSYLLSLPALQAGGGEFEDASLDISDSLVNVLSVHRSKGLEWDTVYVVDCTEGSFPMRKFGSSLEVPVALRAVASTADEHLAEERRLMYVAVTRARCELILSYADRHGSGAHRKPSRFLAELFDNQTVDTIEHEERANFELFAPRELPERVPLPDSMYHDGQFVLTASQIECWLDCPQDFYYKHVLRMPEPESPAASYGTAIHSAIEAISNGRRNGNVPTLDEIITQVQAALPQTGYATAGTRERAHAQALESVKRIYQRFTTEEPPIETEQQFGALVPNLPVKIIGRIDAIYRQGDGVEIRDYKTSSSVTTPEKAKSRATGSQQLTVYALAWQIMHDELPVRLTLDFVETGQLGSVRKTQRSLDTLQSKLATMVADLQAGHYPPGRDHTYCSHPIIRA